MPSIDAKKFWLLTGGVGFIGVALVVYSQTLAFTWDEGFHLIAEQLVNAGKTPYLDFLFAQTPLNIWWTAFWMRIFGQSWHLAHALAAIETAGGVMLAADYVLRRFGAPEWRLQAALTTAFLTGLNVAVVEYGTLGQAYGMCLLMTVAAFRLAVLVPRRRSIIPAILSGAAAGIAAGSSLLTVTVAPVLLLWVVWRSRAGNRWIKAAAFAVGAIIPLVPILWLFVKSPQQVFFDVVDFHLFYRQIEWDGWEFHDLDVLTAWIDCTQAFILGGLGIAGMVFLRRSDWESDVRAEFYLSAGLAIATGGYLMTAHPTFPRYFLLITPFAGIVASAGLYALIRRMRIPLDARWPVALVIVLMMIGAVRSTLDDSDDSWYQFEPIARKVGEVTPPGAMLFADEHVYFLLKRMPPEGMNWNGGHKIDLPMDKAAPLHVLPRPELVRRVQAGVFDTVETCGQGEPDTLGLAKIYRQNVTINDCFVYWDKRIGETMTGK